MPKPFIWLSREGERESGFIWKQTQKFRVSGSRESPLIELKRQEWNKKPERELDGTNDSV